VRLHRRWVRPSCPRRRCRRSRENVGAHHGAHATSGARPRPGRVASPRVRARASDASRATLGARGGALCAAHRSARASARASPHAPTRRFAQTPHPRRTTRAASGCATRLGAAVATAAEAAAAAEAAVRWVQPLRRHSLHHAGADADASCVAAVEPPRLPRQPL